MEDFLGNSSDFLVNGANPQVNGARPLVNGARPQVNGVNHLVNGSNPGSPSRRRRSPPNGLPNGHGHNDIADRIAMDLGRMNLQSPRIPGTLSSSSTGDTAAPPPSRASTSNRSMNSQASANLSLSVPIRADQMMELGHFLSDSSSSGSSYRGCGRNSCHKHPCSGCAKRPGSSEEGSEDTTHGFDDSWLGRIISFLLKNRGNIALFMILSWGLFTILHSEYYSSYDDEPEIKTIDALPTMSIEKQTKSNPALTTAEEMYTFAKAKVERENKVFERLYDLRKDEISPALAYDLDYFLDRQIDHATSVLKEFLTIYNGYTDSLYITLNQLANRHLQLQRDKASPGDLLNVTEPWIRLPKFIFGPPKKEAIQAPAAVHQYQHYWSLKQDELREMEPRFRNFTSFCRHISYCVDIKRTLDKISDDPESPSNLVRRMMNDIKKPCEKELELLELLETYTKEVQKAIDQCEEESQNVMKPVLHWKDHFGKSDEEKQIGWSLEILTQLDLVIVRAYERIFKVSGRKLRRSGFFGW